MADTTSLSAMAVPPATAPRAATADRTPAEAATRCLCYAVLSEMTASPHDVDAREVLRPRLATGEALSRVADLHSLLAEMVAAEPHRLKTEYSGLFEVGSQGPPVPIREDLQTGQLSGTREDIVRFYDYFGYALDGKFAWAPDHLSVELEFMHFLTYREAEARDGVLSYQLAQLDFSGRHLAKWLPALARNVQRHAAGSLYGRVVDCVHRFVLADFAWQNRTITGSSNAGPAGDGLPTQGSPLLTPHSPDEN
jgi:DMSO reductase family type II enzyme chaperone